MKSKYYLLGSKRGIEPTEKNNRNVYCFGINSTGKFRPPFKSQKESDNYVFWVLSEENIKGYNKPNFYRAIEIFKLKKK